MTPRTLRRIWLIASATAGLIVIAGAIWMPEFFSAWLGKLSPGCLFRRLTGLSCPGCGGTRAVQALLHGDWHAALKFNMFLWPSLLLLMEEYLRLAILEIRGGETISSSRWYVRLLQCYSAAAVLWFALRNVFGV